MTDRVDKLANDAYRLAATEGLRRIPRELLVDHVRVVLARSPTREVAFVPCKYAPASYTSNGTGAVVAVNLC